MQTTEHDRLSRIRQSLSQLAHEIEDLLPPLMERQPMVKGTVYEQRRKCGKPNCACATGEPHRSMMLSRSEEGRTKLMAIPTGHLKELEVLTERYQRFRRARARLGQIYKKMLELIDQLEAARRQEP
jgi:chromosome segregation ATPase